MLPGESKLSMCNCKPAKADHRAHNAEHDSSGVCATVTCGPEVGSIVASAAGRGAVVFFWAAR